MKRTVREVKNAILSDMTYEERTNAVVGDTGYGGYLIVTPGRVFEIYEYRDGTIDVSVKKTVGDWEDYE